MNIGSIIVAIIIAYLIGSFPTAYLVGRWRKGFDIREVGSRNLGAMNTFYKVGFGWGLLVLAADIGKGVLGPAIAHFLGNNLIVEMLSGVAVVVGHSFPVFLKFRGGRGGASCIGILVYLMPWGAPVYLGLFLLLLAITRFPTLSYSAAFLCFPFIGAFVYHRWELAVYSLGLLLLPLLKYIPRIIEMRKKAGSWKHVIYRRNLKDRL
ncbi:MAG: glycerol-3-phosphate acyltransferase [Dehalococcoidales bacterium]|nr:glycerol-3-phosphate acyltransferase [Dehalococcoidales bacterium]